MSKQHKTSPTTKAMSTPNILQSGIKLLNFSLIFVSYRNHKTWLDKLHKKVLLIFIHKVHAAFYFWLRFASPKAN